MPDGVKRRRVRQLDEVDGLDRGENLVEIEGRRFVIVSARDVPPADPLGPEFAPIRPRGAMTDRGNQR